MIKHPYEDILDRQRPEPIGRVRMPLSDRAAQFAPFAALTGYEQVIAETGRLTSSRIELEEQEKQRHTAARRFWWMLGLVILLLLLAVGLPLLLFTGRLLERLQEERAADIQQWSSLQEQSGALSGKVEATQQLISVLQEEQRRNAAASRHAETEATRMRREQQAELEKMTVSLDRDREDYQRNLQALQKELEQQRREAETVRQRWEQETGRRHEAELARLKEDFAVRQRELLEKLEKEVAARKAAENRAEAESETAQTQPAVANPVNPAVSAGTTAGKEQP